GAPCITGHLLSSVMFTPLVFCILFLVWYTRIMNPWEVIRHRQRDDMGLVTRKSRSSGHLETGYPQPPPKLTETTIGSLQFCAPWA
ncbi:MAG: hypothetical protein ACR2PA_08785, partial [Hyphomicrobiaceae bacterium]